MEHYLCNVASTAGMYANLQQKFHPCCLKAGAASPYTVSGYTTAWLCKLHSFTEKPGEGMRPCV